VDDAARLRAFMEENPFAVLVTHADGRPFGTHLPILIENAEGAPTRLLGHVARANPQWQHFENASDVLLIFHGPHAYISPFWYAAAEAVPTWNYGAVHAYGKPRLIQDERRAREIVERLTRQYEGRRADELFARWSPAFLDKMLKGIVAFEIDVVRLEGKFKLGQNRNAADLAGTYEALKKSEIPGDRALAELMKQTGILGT
jgi:transcriptional regulator